MLLFRYLSASSMLTTSAVTLVLLLIVTSGRLAKYLSQASSGNLAADLVFSIILYRIPDFLPLIIPLGLFVGILLAYGRFYVDSEMTVIHATGVSKSKVLWMTLVPAALISMLVAALTLWIAPASLARVGALLEESRNTHGLALFRAGKFQTDRAGDSVVYVESLPTRERFEHIVLVEQRDDGGIVLVRADGGRILPTDDPNERLVELQNGRLYEGLIGSRAYQLTRFGSYTERVELRREAEQVNLKIDALPTRELMGSNELAHRAALHWRFSLPATVIVVAILAVPLSRTDRRRGRYTKMLPAILLYLVYIVSLSGARSMVESAQLPVAT
ncbi:MAG: LPS export ABC transporter permease LptF, partial [Pseudomonadales bacterium]|nr:LPS export ABC transporter permease LptF [Pseudomonadales bacterium]